MRVLLKSHKYLNLITHNNSYFKSNLTKINTAIAPPSISDAIAFQHQQKYMAPVNALSIGSQTVHTNHTGQNGKNKSSDLASSKSSKKAGKKSKKAGKIEQQELKNFSAKQLKHKNKRQQILQQAQLQAGQNPNQFLILEQFPALRYLKESISAVETVASKKGQSFNWKKKGPLYSAAANEQSIQFMRLIAHSMQRQSCLRVISQVEEYCSQDNSKTSQKKIQIQTYNKIKKILQKQLTFSHRSASQSSNFISLILNSLKNTNPQLINSSQFDKTTIFRNDVQQIKENKSSVQWDNGQTKSLTYQIKQIQSEQRTQKKPKSISKAIRLRKNILSNPEDKKPLVQIKITSQNLLFKQVISKADPQKDYQSKHFAYLYDLPYGITQQDGKQLVEYLHETKGVQVKQFVLFPYKNMLENTKYEIVYHIPEDMKESKIQKIYYKSDIDNVLTPKDKNHKKKKTSKPETPQDGQNLEFSNTDVMLERIRRQDYSRFNKSVMVIKLETEQQKKNLVTRWTRLFGLNFKHLKNIKFQEAYRKTTITVSNLPSGCTSTSILEVLNKALSQQNISLSVDEDCYLSKQYIEIEFAYFVDALQAVHLMNNLSFQGKNLNAKLNYGPLRVFNSSYSEPMETNRQTWERIAELTEEYHLKFQEQDQELYQ